MSYIEDLRRDIEGMDGRDAVHFLMGQLAAYSACSQSAFLNLNPESISAIKSSLALAAIAEKDTGAPMIRAGFKRATEAISAIGA